MEEAADEIMKQYHKQPWEKDFQYDLLTAFWLAVHCEEVDYVRRITQYDISLRQLIALAMKNKPERPDGWTKKKSKGFVRKSPDAKRAAKGHDLILDSPSLAGDECEGGSEDEEGYGEEEDVSGSQLDNS